MRGMSGIFQIEEASCEERARLSPPDGLTKRLGSRGEPCAAVVSLGESDLTYALDATPLDASSVSWAVCDGRIHNADALLPLLRARNADFSPCADAELVLAAYRHWGKECPQHLYGDYVFAIWDAPRRQLFFARDPAKQHPLYYTVQQQGTRFLWASDIETLLQAPGVSRDYDLLYLQNFALFGDNRTERTPYEAIKRLRGGWSLRVTEEGTQARAWWRLPGPGSLRYATGEEYQEHLRALLRESVWARARSDKKVSIALSGGIDSACAAWTTLQAVQNDPSLCPGAQGITVALSETPESDESGYARRNAQHIGLPHRVVSGDNTHFCADLPAVQSYFAEPNYTALFWEFHQTLRDACLANGSDTLLNGGGGHTLFFADLGYLGDILLERRLPLFFSEFRRWRRQGIPAGFLWKKTLQPLTYPEYRLFPATERLPWFKTLPRSPSPPDKSTPQNPLIRQMYLEFTEVEDSFCDFARVLYGAAGIACRSPLQDRRLIEFAYALPLERIVSWQSFGKPLLREAFAREIPIQFTLENTATLQAYAAKGIYWNWDALTDLIQKPPDPLPELLDVAALRRELPKLRHTHWCASLLPPLVLAAWLKAREQQPFAAC